MSYALPDATPPSVLQHGVKLIDVHAGSAPMLARQSGDAGLNLEQPSLGVVQLSPGGGDSPDRPT